MNDTIAIGLMWAGSISFIAAAIMLLRLPYLP
jgi:hypothetical protein